MWPGGNKAPAATLSRLQKVASLRFGITGLTLREIKARTRTEYLARTIGTSAQRDHPHTVRLAARALHGRLGNDYEKAAHHEVASDLASPGEGPRTDVSRQGEDQLGDLRRAAERCGGKSEVPGTSAWREPITRT